MNNCSICQKELDGNKRMYCSNKCKQKAHYNKNKNSNTYHSQTIRGLKRKIELIKLKGGSCNNCGYSNNISALEFNHLCCKTFTIDLRALSNKKWEDLAKEVENCNLLCANCHREYHHEELSFSNIENIINQSVIKKKNKRNDSKCEICNKYFKRITGKKYCSEICRNKSKNFPKIDNIIEKYNEYKSWKKVSEYFGLSEKTIRKIRK